MCPVGDKYLTMLNLALMTVKNEIVCQNVSFLWQSNITWKGVLYAYNAEKNEVSDCLIGFENCPPSP